MQGGVRLELRPTTTSPLAIDMEETSEKRIQRLITENPVVIFSRSSCCMCHVMRHLLSAVGVQPTVIELDDVDILSLPSCGAPIAFIGGTSIGGLESLMALHLGGDLVPKLIDIGAI